MNFQNAEERVQRHPGDDPGERERQDEQERDCVPAEEPEAVDRESGRRAEHEATIVVPAAAFSDRSSACCISPSWIVGLNHFVVQSVIGQP